MTKWDTRFLELARMVAGWSKDPRGGVGAVITQGNRIVSVGFNGLPRRVQDLPERYGRRAVLHAEENAILFGGHRVAGGRLYVWPLMPCPACTARMIQVGIAELVTPSMPPVDQDPESAAAWLLAKQMLREAGMQVQGYQEIGR